VTFRKVNSLPLGQLLRTYPGAGLSCRPFADPNGMDVVRALLSQPYRASPYGAGFLANAASGQSRQERPDDAPGLRPTREAHAPTVGALPSWY
jgi:hypothetical protein